MSHNTRLTNFDESRRARQHAKSRARRRQLLLFLAAQARKLTLSGPLGWAEGALKCHSLNNNGGKAIGVLSVFSVFWVYPSVVVLFTRSSWLKKWAYGRHDFVCSRHRRGMVWGMVCYGL